MCLRIAPINETDKTIYEASYADFQQGEGLLLGECDLFIIHLSVFCIAIKIQHYKVLNNKPETTMKYMAMYELTGWHV